MSKVALGPKTLIYPMPSFLVGANVDDKPNFMTVAWSGIVNSRPPMISVSLQHHRYTYRGVKQNLAFSVNVPSVDLLKETDYCGIRSGSEADKVEVCQFKVFYGKLSTAPLIEQCLVNLECKVVHILDLGTHLLVVGSIEETYVSESCLTDGKPDVDKIKPLIYIEPTRQYRGFGEVVGKAYKVGLALDNVK